MSTATSTQINSDELNFLTRVQTLPLVNDFNSLLESNSYSSAAIKQLNTIYSNHSALVTSLPLKRLNSFGNVALDQLESRIPQLKTIDTNSLLISVKSTPDHAKQIAKTLVEAANLAVTERLQQGSETIHQLQDRLFQVLSSIPKDVASAQAVIASLFKELDSISHVINTQFKELPAEAKKLSQPVLDRLQEAFTHIKGEAAKPDVPLSTKSATILAYSQSQLLPLITDSVKVFTSLVPTVVAKKADESATVVSEKAEVVHAEVVNVAAGVENAVNGEKIKKSKRSSKTVLVD